MEHECRTPLTADILVNVKSADWPFVVLKNGKYFWAAFVVRGQKITYLKKLEFLDELERFYFGWTGKEIEFYESGR